MPQKSKANLPPLNLGKESLGERLCRLRKERGYTQAELAEKIGIVREIISEYERAKLRPHYEMIIRLALALEVSTDELLGLKPSKSNGTKPSPQIMRRMKKIEELPPAKQKFLLKTIDTFLKGTQ